MPPTQFKPVLDLVQAQLTAPYNPGATTFSVTTGTGQLFALGGFPLRVTVTPPGNVDSAGRVVDRTLTGDYIVNSRLGDNLNELEFDHGADQQFPSGSVIGVWVTFKTFDDIHTAINACEVAIAALQAGGGGGSGTVTNVDGVGFAGITVNVTNQSTTPHIALSTTLNGIVLANGSGFVNAVAGTHYVAPTAQLTALAALGMTKGNLIGGTGSSFGVLAVGADGTVLTADATQPEGWKWAAPSGGSGANALGTYITQGTANAPANGQSLGTLATGLVLNTVTAGVGVLSTATPGTDYLRPNGDGHLLTGLTGSQITGNITGNAASITGAITEAQVTNLVSDLSTLTSSIAAKATDANVVHLGTTESITGAKTFTQTITGNISGNAGGTAANVTGTVAIANGGTGQTTANAAFNALAPAQGTHANQPLVSDGTNTSWSLFPYTRGFAIGQNGNAVANGTAVAGTPIIVPYGGFLQKVMVKCETNPGGGGFSYSVTKNGTAVTGAPVAIAAGTTTTQTNSTFTTSPLPVAAGDVFNVDISGAGSGVLNGQIQLVFGIKNG